jgi:Uncharacterized protein conserved in bacteria (DUF2147)
MNAKQRVITLAVISLLGAPVFTSALAARPRVPNIPASTQTNQIVSQELPSFIGRTWQAEDDRFRVQFFKENNVYNGKLVWLPPSAETKDVKNSDPNLRSRDLIGSVMFQGFTYDPSKKELTGGTVYIPDMGRTMQPTLSLAGEDQIKMQISMGFMSRTVTLTAVK